MKLGSLTIGIERCRVRTRRPPSTSPRLVLGAVLVCTALATMVTPAAADPGPGTGSVTATVNMAVRSVSVSLPTLVYQYCESDPFGPDQTADGLVSVGMSIPNGQCGTADLDPHGPNDFTVTNGDVADWVEVSSSAFAPVTPATGPGWTLCATTSPEEVGTGLPICNGPTDSEGFNEPAADQASVSFGQVVDPSGRVHNMTIGPTPVCDTVLVSGGCSGSNLAGVGQVDYGSDGFSVWGPSSVTSAATSFANAVTFWAVPPS